VVGGDAGQRDEHRMVVGVEHGQKGARHQEVGREVVMQDPLPGTHGQVNELFALPPGTERRHDATQRAVLIDDLVAKPQHAGLGPYITDDEM